MIIENEWYKLKYHEDTFIGKAIKVKIPKVMNHIYTISEWWFDKDGEHVHKIPIITQRLTKLDILFYVIE